MKYWLLGIVGLSGGLIISAGVFALITSTGLMSRLAGKTHTGRYVRLYEDAVMAGGTIFNLLYVLEGAVQLPAGLARWGIGIFAVFAGIFVGCLAVSLAEALKATAVFSRRAKLSTGISFIVLAAAIGKMLGALVQFFMF